MQCHRVPCITGGICLCLYKQRNHHIRHRMYHCCSTLVTLPKTAGPGAVAVCRAPSSHNDAWRYGISTCEYGARASVPSSNHSPIEARGRLGGDIVSLDMFCTRPKYAPTLKCLRSDASEYFVYNSKSLPRGAVLVRRPHPCILRSLPPQQQCVHPYFNVHARVHAATHWHSELEVPHAASTKQAPEVSYLSMVLYLCISFPVLIMRYMCFTCFTVYATSIRRI